MIYFIALAHIVKYVAVSLFEWVAACGEIMLAVVRGRLEEKWHIKDLRSGK